MFSSPVTSWIAIVYEVLIVMSQAIKDTPVPSTPEEWVALFLKILPGLGIFFSKDWNKTNAVQANPTPQTAPTVPSTMAEPTAQPGGSTPGFLGGPKTPSKP